MTQEQKNLFDKIIAKRKEYYQCIAHLNLRGAADVKQETIPLLEEVKQLGFTGKEFRDYFKSINPDCVISKDVFIKGVVKFLNKK